MECECRDAVICNDYTYGEACVWLAERKHDCTIIDVGFGGGTGLHEVQRHLRRHGIEARTIGIDIQKCDAEIDEFIHADMRDVKLPGAADVVICHYVLGGFNANAAGFQRAVENCADWLKPDGLFFTNLRKDLTSTDYLNGGSPYSLLRAMSKVETKEHAAQCHRMMAERCPHGKELNMRRAVRLDPVSWHNGGRLAKGVSQESILRDAGVDPRERMEMLAERARLMKAGAHLRTVPPKDLNRRCSTASLTELS